METTTQHPEPAISKLSAEILSYIFILNVNRISRQSLKTSVNSSHVCRLWRRVILSYPELWSRMIFLDYPTEWLNELLRRSEPLLIDVEWLPSFSDHCLLDRPKFDCASRFRSCKLMPSTEGEWDLISTAFQVLSTPHLSELQLKFRTLSCDPTRPIFPSSALQQLNAPSLRSLSFTNCGPDFSFPSSLSNITSLTVVDWYHRHGITEAPQTCQSLFHWLQLLSKMPQLSSVTITRSILRGVSRLPPKLMVSLPNLRLLDLSETSQRISLMLNRIRFPTSSPCKMQLFCDDSVVNSKETASIIGVFTQSLEYQALAEHELHTLKIGANGGMHEARFEFSISTEKIRDESEIQGPWTEERLANELTFYDRSLFVGGTIWLSYLEPILTALDRSLIKVKSISLPCEKLNSVVLHHLKRATGIETLVRPSPAVIASLIPGSSEGAIPLPNLRNIIIFDRTLVKDGSDSFSDLCTLLRVHISAGSPIKHIWLRYCSVSSRNAQILRDLGVEIRGEIC